MSAQTSVRPLDNAVDSIRRMTEGVARRDVMGLKSGLAWGWHAVGLLAYVRLQPYRDSFDAWMSDYLHEGEPALDVDRDARWENQERLSSLELLDLLSEVGLPILKPELYQGWQDRTSRCRILRGKVGEIIGGSVDGQTREKLLLLLAAYHRLVRLPAEVTLDATSVMAAMPALCDLLALLVPPGATEWANVTSAITEARSATLGLH